MLARKNQKIFHLNPSMTMLENRSKMQNLLAGDKKNCKDDRKDLDKLREESRAKKFEEARLRRAQAIVARGERAGLLRSSRSEQVLASNQEKQAAEKARRARLEKLAR